MARHLWAFCVALATASQPQNATRQLDAYAPAPTDLLCANNGDRGSSSLVLMGIVRRTSNKVARGLPLGRQRSRMPAVRSPQVSSRRSGGAGGGLDAVDGAVADGADRRGP
jgi:hypothetical protein